MENFLREVPQLTLSFEPERQVFGVSELNAAIQRLFERQFRRVWVAGEISGCRAAASGHYYFSLKDAECQLKCALFKGTARYIRCKPQDGLSVIVRGNLEVYQARGEYQLLVEAIEPQGAGALQLAFEQLKQKLAAEGLFDSQRKRPLPTYPRRIGIVTSPAGAVIRDMLHVLERRFPGLHIRLFPAQVQGEGSVEQVCRALSYFGNSEWAQVIIVARGGGSLEDLWTFNEERVARAIVASAVPVLSAIGHETDFTIADFVADHRAPTPSAAAEIVICTRESLFDLIAGFEARAGQSLRYKLLKSSRDLYKRGTERASVLVHRMLARRAQQVDELDHRMRSLHQQLLLGCSRRLAELRRRLEAADLRLRLARDAQRLEALREQLLRVMRATLWAHRRKLETPQAHLKQMNPYAVLSRGYAIVEANDRRILRQASETQPGEALRVRLSRGQLAVRVEGTRDDQ